MTHASRRIALAGVFVGAMLIGVAYASAWHQHGPPVWGVWAMVIGAALVLSATLALGALRSKSRTGIVLLTALFLFVVIVAGFGLPLLLPDTLTSEPLLLGLPFRAAIEIYGVGLLPILVLPFVFAREFRRGDLDEASLARMRAECARLRDEAQGSAGRVD